MNAMIDAENIWMKVFTNEFFGRSSLWLRAEPKLQKAAAITKRKM
jgi:hypothetical protein